MSRPLLRAVLSFSALGALASLAGRVPSSLEEALRARGLTVRPGSVRWVDEPTLWRPRRALLLAATEGGEADVYAVSARTAGAERLVSLGAVSNLTRSRDASEEALVLSGTRAAFVTRTQEGVRAVTLLDLRGDAVDPTLDSGARLRQRVARWQATGTPEGYGEQRFELRSPWRSVRLTLDERALRLSAAGREVEVSLADGRVLRGEELVRAREREEGAPPQWVPWLVDTVRSVPWIGPAPIAWAESWAFAANHRLAQARNATLGVRTQEEVTQDLANLLAVRPPTGVLGPVRDWPPAPLRGTVSPALRGEGEWTPVAGDADPFVRSVPGQPSPLYLTWVRTEPERPDTRVYLTVWDPRAVELHVVPGSIEPVGPTGEHGTGAIPRDEATLRRALGGFNGAFQAVHGEYGVYAEGTMLLPPKGYAATVMVLADGSVGFGSWPPERQTVPEEVLEYRQNLTAVVDEGTFNPWRRTYWGGTVGASHDEYTTRTALCLTREGYVVYLWGQSVGPQGLGNAMLAARCGYGVHLDMNGSNTGFEVFRVDRPALLPPLGRSLVPLHEVEGSVSGVPGLRYRARRLLRAMSETLPRYLRRDPRDFFYLALRDVLPGAPLEPVVQPAQPGEGRWLVAGLGDAPFPWPLARTQLRPDVARPERWVTLLRLDPRRVALHPGAQDGPGERVLLRAVNLPATADAGASGATLRLSRAVGTTGPRWVLGGAEGEAVGEALGAGSSAQRGLCVDGSGYLLYAVADRALPDLVAQALEHAGCHGPRAAVRGWTLALPSGQGAAGDAVSSAGPGLFALTEAAWVAGRRLFPEVRPVPLRVWQPVLQRRVRYHFDLNGGTVQLAPGATPQ